nr:alpha amylase C-terminal domain-containing protein [Lachnospiraceae bacterium]
AQDYDYIDPHFGKIVTDGGDLLVDSIDNQKASKYIRRTTDIRNLEASNELFAELVAKAHRHNIKVIIDGVFNHCGSFHKWLDREEIYYGQQGYEKGAYISEDSPYRNYFDFHDENGWPYNSSYDGWWGHETLPKLNYEGSRKLQEHILDVARKWVSPPFNADGWRLDVAADLGHSSDFNHSFWQRFRKAVKEANPNAVIIAEHYGDASSWLKGGEWDSIMNYDAFMEPVTFFLTGMQKHSDEFRPDLLNNADAFWHTMRDKSRQFTTGSLMCAMNELSNHDHSRFLTRTNRKVGRLGRFSSADAKEGVNQAVMREAVLIQMTWVGAPTIYYGDEVGLCGFTDPDNRRPFPWGNEDFELMDFHRACIRIHKENPELRTGSLKKLLGEPGLIAYGRFHRKDICIIVINNRETAVNFELPIWECGCPREGTAKRIIYTNDISFSTDPKEFPIQAGKVLVNLPPTSGQVLKIKRE